MCGFIKLLRSAESEWLFFNHPNAYRLLTLIAMRARLFAGHPDGLLPGECHIGDHKTLGLTEKEYRVAKERLLSVRAIEIVETCRNRKKGATGRATVGTKVKIISSDIYDINLDEQGDRKGEPGATEGRPKGEELRKKESKEDKKEHTSAGASELALFLYQQIQTFKPDYPEPNLAAWAKIVDSMLKAGRVAENIKAVIAWLPSNDFWRKNILSTASLKKQFDKLELNMQQDAKPKSSGTQSFTNQAKAYFKNGNTYAGYECFIDAMGITFTSGTTQQIFLFGSGFEDKCGSFLSSRGIKLPLAQTKSAGIELSDHELQTILKVKS